MRTAVKIIILAIIASLAAAQAIAEELTPAAEPLPPPQFFIHAGMTGIFPQTNASPEGGGIFPQTNPLPVLGGLFAVSNIAIRPLYTFTAEFGYYVTPHLAISFFTGVPPLVHLKATGSTLQPLFHTDLAGSLRAGIAQFFVQYHFTDVGPVRPYAGVGVGYLVNLGNINDGILTHVSLDQNFALVLQAGAEFMLTHDFGVFVDAKKALFSTDAQGFLLNAPVRALLRVDPWLATAGLTFKFY